MEQRRTTALFVILIILALTIFLLDRTGILLGLRAGLEGIFSPAERAAQKLVKDKLDEQKLTIDEKLAELKELQRENEALRAQLGVVGESNISPKKLLLAHVLSASRFFVIDKGSDDGIMIGQAVFFKNVFIGKITTVSGKVSRVRLATEFDSNTYGKTKETGALGLARGQGDSMIFSEVILSENLKAGDSVQTVGNVDERGIGILPNLIIGAIENVRKSPNQLFWEATLKPAIEYQKLEEVFISL